MRRRCVKGEAGCGGGEKIALRVRFGKPQATLQSSEMGGEGGAGACALRNPFSRSPNSAASPGQDVGPARA